MSLISITSGLNKIIAHGTAISYNRDPIEITFKPDNESNTQSVLKILFSFHDDTTISDSKMDAILNEEDGKLEFKLFNFNSSFDTGNVSPLIIGHDVNEKNIFLNYRARKIGDSWTLDFSIYQQL